MKKISVSIIAHNEAEHLEKCLKSVSWADEIIVVDCESNDATISIARNYTDKVFSRPNLLNLNLNKSFGIEKTTGDWILYLDPDERVSGELATEIKEILKDERNQFQGFFIPRRNHYLGRWLRWGGQYPDWQLRLFQRERGRFPCKHIHERLEIDGKIGRLSSPLGHYPYQNTDELLRKLILYADFQSDFIWNKGVMPNLFVAWRYLFWRPVTRFLRRYFLKLGFLDGYPGFLACLSDILTSVFTYSKLWEKEKVNKKQLVL